MEAATHGVPAVAYREAGGVAESIVHEQTGMLVDGDLEDFAQALDAVLSNPAHRDRLGESARIRSEEFTWRQRPPRSRMCSAKLPPRAACQWCQRRQDTWNTTVGETAVWISSP